MQSIIHAKYPSQHSRLGHSPTVCVCSWQGNLLKGARGGSVVAPQCMRPGSVAHRRLIERRHGAHLLADKYRGLSTPIVHHPYARATPRTPAAVVASSQRVSFRPPLAGHGTFAFDCMMLDRRVFFIVLQGAYTSRARPCAVSDATTAAEVEALNCATASASHRCAPVSPRQLRHREAIAA